MEPDVLGELSDLRNQLDAAVRFCAVAGIATVISVGLLLWHGAWLFMALAMYLLTWACYRSSVAAARRFSLSLAAAVDLYHLRLYDALSLERPADLEQERERNVALSRLFSGELEDYQMGGFKFLPPKTDAAAADQGSKELRSPLESNEAFDRRLFPGPIAGLPEDAGRLLISAGSVSGPPQCPQHVPQVA